MRGAHPVALLELSNAAPVVQLVRLVLAGAQVEAASACKGVKRHGGRQSKLHNFPPLANAAQGSSRRFQTPFAEEAAAQTCRKVTERPSATLHPTPPSLN